MEKVLIKTGDGSHSIYVKDLDEHYHSIHGAIQESIHIFINNGLKYIASQKPEINILEIGFGTGLNTLLTLIEAKKLNIKINYSTIEAYPLNIEIVNELNYVELITSNSETNNLISQIQNKNSHENITLKSIFGMLHTSEWDKEIVLTDNFILHKIKKTLQEIKFDNKFDLIYFDAFGPRVQPEMWTEELFSKIFVAVNPNGCLVTYCAKGEVKRTLKRVGFIVETLPGPPRKREMVRGIKNQRL